MDSRVDKVDLANVMLNWNAWNNMRGASRPKDDDGEDGRLESHAHVFR